MQLGRPTGRLFVVDTSVALDDPDATSDPGHDGTAEPMIMTPPAAATAERPEGTAAD